MSSPQLENGYTRLANGLLDAMLQARFTSRQWAVVMAIVRKTYGYNKKEDDIGLSQLAEMTGMAKTHVGATVRDLSARRVLTRKTGSFGHILAINKNFNQWILDDLPATETVTPPVTELVSMGDRIGSKTVTETVTPPVTELVTTKDNPSKDNQKTTPKDTFASQAMRDRFSKFYAEYPKKKSRAKAEKAFAKINPDEQLLAAMIAGIRRAMKSGQWQDPQFIPHPASWLRACAWDDEIQTEYSESERAVIQTFNDVLGEQLGVIDDGIFVESRAAAIRTFLTLSEKPEFWKKFFPWVSGNCDLPPRVGFDWLISADAFTKVKGGQHTKKDAA